MNCKNFKIKQKNYKRIFYCSVQRKEIDYHKCSKGCKDYEDKIKNSGFLNKSTGLECKSTGLKKKSKLIKGKKHKLTKATEIPKKIKLIVWERDNHECIFCHTPVSWHYANSHYIKRSHSGLGIEPKNIMTNCARCHKLFEESIYREQMKAYAKNYFINIYEDWSEECLVYRKY